jgi:tetratricopeptide (TPR) repeat protein
MVAAWADARTGLPPADEQAATRLVAASRRLDERSTLVQGLVLLADGHRDRADALLAEAEQVLRTVPERGTALPRWFVVDTWSLMSIDTGFFDAERALEYARHAAEVAVGMEVARTRCNLGEALVLRGRFAEALDALELFEHPLPATEAVPVVQVLGALRAAEARIALGRADAAEQDLRLAEAALRAVDLPEEAAAVALLHAVADRALGHPEAAARRLDAVLRAAPDQDAVGRFRWLRAVLHREAGDVAAAGGAVAAVRTADDPDLARLVRLERAAQRLETDPIGSARAIAAVLADPVPQLHVLGSVYDTDAMLQRVRGRFGWAALDRALAGPGAPETAAVS